MVSENSGHGGVGSSLSLCGETFPAIAQIVDEDKLAELVEVGIVCSPLVGLCELVDEIDEVWVACNHERTDNNLLPAALDGLVERLVDNARVEAKRVLVQPPGLIKDRRRLSVRDHEDLFVGVAASVQQTACQLQSCSCIRMIRSDGEEWQLAEAHDFRLISEYDERQIVLGEA